MAQKSDGKVIISTELDNSNLPNGIKDISGKLGGLKNVVKSLGAAIGAAFSVVAIVNFAKESVQAANELSDALTGLKSILAGQGRSFSDAEKFLQEYTADGLVPMTNAITAYKNLASRGYDDSQIQKTLVALKDAAAFGRAASYSMGDAVQSATEGLKNENSVLVDNAGVTKNVAKMWEEYAASIGTTANNLTQEQKILAEVNGILEESKFQTGDAAKVAGTLSGQLSQLSVNFNNLKVAVGNALTPIVTAFLPVINSAVAAMTRFANSIASVIGALLGSGSAGTVQEVADSYENAATGAENLAEQTEAAGKAAKKYLAGFDEITKIGDSSGGTASAVTNTGTAGATVSVSADTNIQDDIAPEIQALVDKIYELIEPLRNISLDPLISSFDRLKTAIEPLTAGLFDGLEWVWSNVLVPLSGWIIEDAAPASVGLVSAALEMLAALIEPLWIGFQQLWESLTPVFEYVGSCVVLIISTIEDAITDLTSVFSEKGEEIAGIFSGIGDIAETLFAALAPLLEHTAKQWQAGFSYIGDIVSNGIGLIIDELFGLIEIIAGVLTGDWERAWNGVVEIFDGIVEYITKGLESLLGAFGLTFDDIVLGTKGFVNGVIGFINGMISGVQNGVNALIEAINKISFTVPDWVPGIGGSTLGFNLQKVSYPQIPYLAKGAVLPANKPFMAMVGDQKHGTNIEAPLETIQEAVAMVMDQYAASNLAGQEAIVGVLREILEAILGIEIGDDVIGQAVARYNRKMAVVRGGT